MNFPRFRLASSAATASRSYRLKTSYAATGSAEPAKCTAWTELDPAELVARDGGYFLVSAATDAVFYEKQPGSCLTASPAWPTPNIERDDSAGANPARSDRELRRNTTTKRPQAASARSDTAPTVFLAGRSRQLALREA
jgi:hypothetical protein